MISKDRSESPVPVQTYKSKKYIFLIVVTFALSTVYQGYCLTCIGSIPLDTIVKIYNISVTPSVASGILNGIMPLGALFGALLSSFLISRFSRRYLLAYTGTVYYY